MGFTRCRLGLSAKGAARPLLTSISLLATACVLPAYAQDRDVEVLAPPVPEFPREAAARGVQGLCYVRFSVDAEGYAFDLRASCTEPIFCNEAKLAVSRARFSPKLIGGVPTIRSNIVYPIDFILSEWNWFLFKFVPVEAYEPGPTEPCDEIAVS